MNSFIRRIRSKLVGQPISSDSRRVLVAVFGKHRGWNDHMEDIGLQSDVLSTLKRILYVQGIVANIGPWSELESKQLSIEFGHAFVWCRNDDVVAGRLWPSTDGKGRTSFPMVACAHCRRAPLRWVHDQVLPHLADLETKCRNSNSADEVKASLSECQENLSGLSVLLSDLEEERPGQAQLLARLAADPELGPGGEGLLRILYHIEREMQAGSPHAGGKNVDRRSALARIPLSGSHHTESSIVWTQLLLGQYGWACGVWALLPPSRTWLDLLVGQPEPPQLYCLRASPDALPLTTTVPFNINPEFAEKIRQRIAHATGVAPSQA